METEDFEVIAKYQLNKLKEAHNGEEPLLVEDVILSGTKFSGYDFSNIHFKNCLFVGAVMEGADFTNVEFVECNLERANFHRATFDGATFKRCSLIQATMNNIHGHTMNLDNVKANNSSWCYADVDGSRFQEVVLNEATLVGANLQKCWFRRLNALGATFRDAVLSGASLHGANLNRTDVSRCELTDTIVEDFDVCGARAVGVDFSRSTFLRGKFNWTKFNQSNFNRAEFDSCDFSNCDLLQVSLFKAKVGFSTFTSAALPATDRILISKWGNVHIQNQRVSIGCQNKTVEEWMNLKPNQLEASYRDYYNTWHKAIKALADACESYPEEVS